MIEEVSTVDQFQDEFVGFDVFSQGILYVTLKKIISITTNGTKDEAMIKGNQVHDFFVGKQKMVPILYRRNYIQIRRYDKLKEILHRIEGIMTPEFIFPKMQMTYDQLYMVYPMSIQVVSLKDGKRSKYSELVGEPEFNKLIDITLLNLVDSLNICVLHLRNRLVFSIIPCTITEIHVQNINSVLLLQSTRRQLHPKKAYLVLLTQFSQLKILNLVNLKQIAEINLLEEPDATIEIKADLECECILVHYINKQTFQIIRNIVYKINSEAYYSKNNNYFQQSQPFILYHFETVPEQLLSVLKVSQDCLFHTYTFCYIRPEEGLVHTFIKEIPRTHRQSPTALHCVTHQQFWQENEEWKQIIATYLQIEDQSIPKDQKRLNYCQEQRQLQQYYELTKDFEQIIARFSDIITFKSQYCTMNQREVEEEWEEYLQQVASDKNLLKQTMSLFKLNYQIVKEPLREANNIGTQMEKCMKEIQERPERIDNKIKEKRQELSRKHQLDKQKQQKPVQKPKLTEEQIKIEQQQYNKFVAQYMAQIQRKKKEQAEADRKRKLNENLLQTQKIDSRLKLQLPKLNEQELKYIKSSSLDIQLNHSGLSSNNQSPNIKKCQEELDPLINKLESSLSPLQEKLESLISKVHSIELTTLETIKSTESKVQNEMDVSLEKTVRESCRVMLSKLAIQIQKEVTDSIEKLCLSESRSVRYFEELVDRFKQYAQAQVKHRVELFHRSRKRLQICAQQIVKQQKVKQNQA